MERLHDVQIDILNATDESETTFRAQTGWSPADLAGKRVLDVGVGAGRFADAVSGVGRGSDRDRPQFCGGRRF